MKKTLLSAALALASGIAIAGTQGTQQTTGTEGTATPQTHKEADHAAYPGAATFEDFDTDQDDVISREEFEAIQERWQGDGERTETRTDETTPMTGDLITEDPATQPETHREAGHAAYPSEEATDPGAHVTEGTDDTATDVDAEPETHMRKSP